MNPNNKKRSSVVFLLLLIFFSGCQKDDFEYADESTVITFEGVVSIYKTNKDYFNYISVQLTEEGKPNAVPSLTLNDTRISVDSKGNIDQNFRWRLTSGYIFDKEVSFNDVFTNISIIEYVKYNLKHNINHWPNDLILPRIKQTEPFIEFYYSNSARLNETITIGELNEMIENGKIEDYFTKMK